MSPDMTYYKCKEVLAVLEADATSRGAAGKNFLGQYSDKHLKEWSGIVGQYVHPVARLPNAVSTGRAFAACVCGRGAVGTFGVGVYCVGVWLQVHSELHPPC